MNWENDRWRLALGLALAGALSGAPYAQAEITVVSPSSLAEMDGSSSSAGGNVCKFQILYPSSDFESVPESHRWITGFAWRPDAANQWSDPATGPVRFRLGTTTADGLSANYEENLGENAQIVFDGELTWQTDNDPPDAHRDFDYVVTFDVPYEYHGGSLVLELQDTMAWNNTTDWLIDSHYFSDGPITAVGGGPFGNTASIQQRWTIPAQFTFAVLEPGDFDGNGVLDIADVNRLQQQIVTGPYDAEFDLNSDESVDGEDLRIWVKDLKNTWYGDADLNGEFNSSDMVQAFVGGKYETGESAGWSEGDWNADAVFDSGDMVAAFVDGGYETGPQLPVVGVPEPASVLLLMAGLTAVAIFRTRVTTRSVSLPRSNCSLPPFWQDG